MTVGRNVGWGLGLGGLLAAPAHAECFNNCGYGTLIAIVIGAGLAVLALAVYVMIRLGIGWLIKWLVGATVLALVIPPVVINARHKYKAGKFEARDFVLPLPMMADRTPLVLFGGSLFNCPDPLERYVKAWAKEGVLAVEMWAVEGVDFNKPVRLADLPLQLHVGGQSAGDDPNYDGPYKGISYHERKLSPEDRVEAAAKVDYVILAHCSDSGDIFDAFRRNPALEGTEDSFDVELAMAPLQKGSGTLSIRDLEFDLLDLSYDGVTEGFLFAGYRRGGFSTVPYDIEELEASFCGRRGGEAMPDCER